MSSTSRLSVGDQPPLERADIGSRSAFIIALTVIALSLAGLWLRARADNFLLCDMECGETILSVNAADQFVAHGVEHGLLENLGSFENPLLYTHNVNIGNLLFVALEAVGIHRFALKVLAPLLVFGLGLFYIYLTVQLFGRSRVVGLVILTVFATTYWGFGTFALNSLRSWHGLAFFMICYHVGRLCREERRPLGQFVGMSAGALFAFGCGYDFWIIGGAVAGMIVLMQASWRQGWRRTGGLLFWLGASFAIPFVLRQLQIVYALGGSYWWQDFVFTVAIKIPGASQYVKIPSMSEVDAFYAARHILRPPATPSNDWPQILSTGWHMIQSVTIPRWGIVTVLIYLLLLVIGTLSRLHLVPSRLRRAYGAAPLIGELLLPMTIGILIGLAAFAPFSLHVYLKHEFPLVAFPLLLARGIALCCLVSLVVTYWRRSVGYLAATAFAAMVVDSAMVHLNASTTGLYPNFDFRHFVQQHPNSTFLLSTYRQMPPDQNVIRDDILGLPPDRVRYADPADARATLSQLTAPGGSNAPDFWIYQPADEKVDFDSAHPTCQFQDWLLQYVDNIAVGRPRKPRLSTAWTSPQSPGPGTTVTLGGTVEHLRPSDSLVLLGQPPLAPVGTVSYSCIYKTLVAWASVAEPMSTVTNLKLIAQRQDGSEIELHDFPVRVTVEPHVVPPIGPFGDAEPSIPALAALAKDLTPVQRDDRGIGYIIFSVPKRQPR